MNKYSRWYNLIINRAKTRKIEDYTETHHIQPRSLGGSNDASNLVDLTAREHFICHWLLTKMYTGQDRGKMINALYIMQGKNRYQKRYQTKITSRVYESLKKEYAEYISSLNKGRVQPMEEKARQKAAMTGRKRKLFSDEWRSNMSKNHKSKQPDFDGSLKEETKKKIGDKIRGRKQTKEEKQRRADANRGKTKPKKLCPHCNQMIAVNTYARWHGDRCRQSANRH
jgi:hypothetical protein